nr:hypothetical protein CFP56_24048 [Quercus suber]
MFSVPSGICTEQPGRSCGRSPRGDNSAHSRQSSILSQPPAKACQTVGTPSPAALSLAHPGEDAWTGHGCDVAGPTLSIAGAANVISGPSVVQDSPSIPVSVRAETWPGGNVSNDAAVRRPGVRRQHGTVPASWGYRHPVPTHVPYRTLPLSAIVRLAAAYLRRRHGLG